MSAINGSWSRKLSRFTVGTKFKRKAPKHSICFRSLYVLSVDTLNLRTKNVSRVCHAVRLLVIRLQFAAVWTSHRLYAMRCVTVACGENHGFALVTVYLMAGVINLVIMSTSFWFILQNVLRELEQKKPQLDELVHTAENLRADTNRQQLHGKGKFFFIFYTIVYFNNINDT